MDRATNSAANTFAENWVSRFRADLVSEGLVTPEQVAVAEQAQTHEGKSLLTTLVDLGYVSEAQLLDVISRHYQIPQIDLTGYVIDSEVVGTIPESVARRHTLIALYRVKDTLTVAMANPLDIVALDDIERLSNLKLTPVLCSQEGIEKALDEYYAGAQAISAVMSDIDMIGLGVESSESISPERLEKITQKAPIVRIVNELILQAVRDGASDIHLEPGAVEVSARYRVDGILRKVSSIPPPLLLPIVSRIKVMANMDLIERRLPQDGRIRVNVGEKAVDLRVSTFPGIYGEKVVMRVLDRSAISLDLAALGFTPADLVRLRVILTNPGGLVLACGPTGSGKTTTLYSMLAAVNSAERNIVTLEDPVEYGLENVTQGQVDAKRGLTFANGLRSILRQDPDVIMVGEMRDLETAELGIRAALTGHLVLSSLHTLSAPATVARLIDMGIDPYLVASSVGIVVAQRLVRRVCEQCKQAYPAPPEHALPDEARDGPLQFFRGTGCKACRQTGYRGRVALYELMLMSEELRHLVMTKANPDEIARASAEAGNRTLEQDGYAKVLAGITTIDELVRETRRWQ